MDSLFFNITDTNYKISNTFKEDSEYIQRVDISNGVLFFQIELESKKRVIKLKNIDRMLFFIVTIDGKIDIKDNISNHLECVKRGEVGLFISSVQDIDILIKAGEKNRAVLIFIADFFLKRYLSYSENEPIDFIYNQLQYEVSLKQISKSPIDALSLYILDNLLNISSKGYMKSIQAEQKILEFIIHQLSLLNIHISKLDKDSYILVKKAKDILTKRYTTPPSIKELAHLCATNETKLKKIFKEAYKSTIHQYIQKLRLEEANLLLKEENLTIGEVSKRVGYRHQGYFSRLFFQYYGVYPTSLMRKFK